MFKSMMIALAIGAMTLMTLAVSADAFPLTLAKPQVTTESNVTLVRDNCGRGRHFSHQLGQCVDSRPGGGRGYGFGGFQGGKEACQQRCLQRREACNYHKGGYFNGCGVQAAACIAKCD